MGQSIVQLMTKDSLPCTQFLPARVEPFGSGEIMQRSWKYTNGNSCERKPRTWKSTLMASSNGIYVSYVYIQMSKAYDTWSDMSHTTCWIQQNLRMSDRVSVSPPKTPRDTIQHCCRKNRTCSIFIKLCLMGKPIKCQVFVHMVMFMFVCRRADINVSTSQM